MKMFVTSDLHRNLSSELFGVWQNFLDDSKYDVAAGEYDQRSYPPAYDIIENDESYLLSVDLPGMKKEEISIEVNDNILAIQGERKPRAMASDTQANQTHRKNRQFKRSFTIPRTVDLSKVEARYEDGVLDLSLPKAVSARPRTIEIQSGKSGLFDKFLGKKAIGEIKDETLCKVN